jgi:hypothetical protein
LADGALGTAGTTGADQDTTAQLLLGSQATTGTSTGVLQDFLSLGDNLCLRYGTCCNTDLCNTGSNKYSFNPFNLFLVLASVFLAKYIF